MGGSNMEVFRFGFYLFFPIFSMYKFGDPVWYETYVQPYKDYLLPTAEQSLKPPKTAAALHEELARLKAERRAKTSTTSSSFPQSETTDNLAISSRSTTSAPPVSRTLKALAADQAENRDRALADGAGPEAASIVGTRSLEAEKKAASSGWGWGSSRGDSSERLV